MTPFLSIRSAWKNMSSSALPAKTSLSTVLMNCLNLSWKRLRNPRSSLIVSRTSASYPTSLGNSSYENWSHPMSFSDELKMNAHDSSRWNWSVLNFVWILFLMYVSVRMPFISPKCGISSLYCSYFSKLIMTFIGPYRKIMEQSLWREWVHVVAKLPPTLELFLAIFWIFISGW